MKLAWLFLSLINAQDRESKWKWPSLPWNLKRLFSPFVRRCQRVEKSKIRTILRSVSVVDSNFSTKTTFMTQLKLQNFSNSWIRLPIPQGFIQSSCFTVEPVRFQFGIWVFYDLDVIHKRLGKFSFKGLETEKNKKSEFGIKTIDSWNGLNPVDVNISNNIDIVHTVLRLSVDEMSRTPIFDFISNQILRFRMTFMFIVKANYSRVSSIGFLHIHWTRFVFISFGLFGVSMKCDEMCVTFCKCSGPLR